MATITRFDTTTRPATDEADERDVVRFFEKRKLIGEIDIDDIVLEDWETKLPEFLTYMDTAKSVDDAVEFLTTEEEEADEAEDEEERESGSVVPEKYREIYGAAQNCGDAIAHALTSFVTTARANKNNPDGGLDRAKLFAVAEINGIADKLARWDDRGLNGGLLRMNVSNVLRGMNRRGELVTIGEQVWAADPAKLEARKERRKAAKKARKGK